MPVRDLVNAASGASAPSDPDFEYVTLLLDGNGTNGAQNNTFVDSSTNNFTITRNGNTTQGSFSPYGNLWSNRFDGSGDYFLLADNSAWTTSSAYTIECWFNPSSLSPDGGTLIAYSSATASAWIVYVNSNGTVLFRWYNTSITEFNLTSSAAISVGTWNHIAVTISGTTATIWINGASSGTLTLSGSQRVITSGQLGIGSWGAATSLPTANGYISNARIVKGTVVYSSSFTPSTTPLTAITNTVLLTCQSNRFVDNSSNNFTLTPTGNVSVQRFSPFEPTAPYSTSVIGGSGYFDGSGDYLSTPTTSAFGFGSDNFTIEGWFYLTTLSGTSPTLFTLGDPTGVNDEVRIFIESNTLRYAFYSTSYLVPITNTGVTPIINTWNHIAMVRNNGVLFIYLNGTQISYASISGGLSRATNTFYLGTLIADLTRTVTGYLSDWRVVVGTAIYSGSTYIVPTAPLSAIANTQLLLGMKNAGIADLSMINNFQTVGNAQVSTAQSKFGGSSLYFDGNGDSLNGTAGNPNVAFGTGDFTVEFWAWKSANGVNNYDGVCGCDTTGNAIGGWAIELSSNRGFYVYSENALVISNNTNPNDSTWHHYALTRSGGTVRYFRDGNLITSRTYSASIVSTVQFRVGVIGSGFFNGYIDDLRITKGIARYVSSFTLPTAPLPIY